MKRHVTILFAALALFSAGCAGEKDVFDGGDGGADPGDAGADGGPADCGPVRRAYEDRPFPQWRSEQFTAAAGNLAWNDVGAVAIDNEGTVWAGGSGGILKYDGAAWLQTPVTEPVLSMAVAGSGLFAATGKKVLALTFSGDWVAAASADSIQAVSALGDDAAVLESRGLGLISGAAAYQLAVNDPSLGGRAAAQSGGKVYVATGGGVRVYSRSGSVFTPAGMLTTADGLPSNDVRAAVADDAGNVWFGTAAGLAVTDGAAVRVITGIPYDDVISIHIVDPETMVISTPIGAAVYYVNISKFRYFHERYWMPDNAVRSSSVRRSDWSIFFATAGGIARVYPEYITLEEKALHYGEINASRHVRMGYTTGCAMSVPGDPATCRSHDDDNDGQWTGMYLGALSFQHAVMKDPAVLERARVAKNAMLKLESVTEAPGFFARSIVDGFECASKQKSGGEWHLTSDGKLCWKGDTSSDEFVGHVFGLGIYYDLVADETEKPEIAATMGRILTRMIDNGYKLVDIDGKVTEHGNFDPAFMESVGLFGDAGLNSAMILGGLLAAHHMTGEQKYLDSYRYLARTKGYKEYIRDIQAIQTRVHINHDSDEMAFLAFYSLMRLEQDPAMRAIWEEGMTKLWVTQRPERNPEFNVIYGAMTDAPDWDEGGAISTLKRIHWDLVVWGCKNSHRKDITINPKPDRFGNAQSTEVPPYDERYVMKWNSNPYNLDISADGTGEESATYWLLPYWMARYHGMISAPQ